ncbi:hypothetical protein [Methyloceanibacter marginalis]|uniref:hypothetical protein n=1 Tax=Methyloceanibacter marginalis TaxID=1774971 RepID=UPI001FCD49D8|nr:hypothetical protein [Methyloceanibacter marginalis]
MVIDVRHDHAFRVPRPDLTETLGVDNACTDCHTDKSAGWAAAAIEKWYGPERKGFQDFGPAFHAAWSGAPDAATLLASVAADKATPAFARASALQELAAIRPGKPQAWCAMGSQTPIRWCVLPPSIIWRRRRPTSSGL